jgi:peptide-methionine (R)-S-oxide reductase
MRPDRRRMMTTSAFLLGALLTPRLGRAAASSGTAYPVVHTEAEWRKMLDPAAFDVLRQAGTEMPWSSPLLHEKRTGRFACAGCAHPAFDSATKYDSGTGWPSFWKPIENAVQVSSDSTFGMDRTEVHCATCGGHLGHVFNDGPQPTGLRYCMNGAALHFIPSI